MRVVRIANRVAVEDAFPEITLYHSSFRMNFGAIRREGIKAKVIDVEAVLARAVDFVAGEYELSEEQKKELVGGHAVRGARERITESEFAKVYLSGDRDFSRTNAEASSEWMDELIREASAVVNADVLERDREFSQRELDIMDRRKAIDKELRALAPDTSTFDERRRLHDEDSELGNETHQLREQRDAELSEAKKAIKVKEREVRGKRFGEGVVVFTVKMPYKVFVRKAASSHTKGKIRDFEKAYEDHVAGDPNTVFGEIGRLFDSVWQFFYEVHLKSVEPQYIESWEFE